MTTSPWKLLPPRFPKLNANLKVDVVVVGGGITGVTAAYLLKRAGATVALLERQRWGGGDTGCTTAHVTYVTDSRISQLVKDFGRDHAQAAWDAGQAAMHQIDENIRHEEIDCDFAWVPGFLHGSLHDPATDESKNLRQDAQSARDLGFDANFADASPLLKQSCVRFGNQALLHPTKYLSGLARQISGGGSHVFEGANVDKISDKPLAVHAGGYTVACGYVVIATHVPLMGKTGLVSATLFQSKLAPYTSYAVGAALPATAASPALYWDMADPYNYLRVERRGSRGYAILGGEDHKTGQVDDTTERFARLEKLLAKLLPRARPSARWSGQVIETNDGLPYIGETAERQFVATGFSGNGITFGTVGAMMARDAALGNANPWSKLFDVGRTKLKGGVWNYLQENVDYPYYMLKDRLLAAEGKSTRSVRRGEGKILKIDGQRVAVARDDEGKLSCVSPDCTHMGCLVRWNQAEQTWDCPCHGSRFTPAGEVLAGPAETPLEPSKAKS